MGLNKSFQFICVSLMLAGCVSQTYKKPPMNAPSTDASIKLAQAATSVSDSLIELSRIEASNAPVKPKKDLPNPIDYEMQKHASVDWSGPIGPLIQRIADASHYRVRVLGNSPAIPVLISLNAHDVALADILRNIDYQAGRKAHIVVYPKRKIIELRYAKA